MAVPNQMHFVGSINEIRLSLSTDGVLSVRKMYPGSVPRTVFVLRPIGEVFETNQKLTVF